MERSSQARSWFADSAAGFVELVGGVTAAELELPGLGEWSIRDLIGHTSRSFITVETYLQAEIPADAEFLPDAAAYVRALSGGRVDHSQVAERGREAGRALGDDPVTALGELAERVTRLVERTADDTPTATAFGPMRLIDYLPTRGFELTVHGLDLAYALGRPVPEATLGTVPQAMALAAAANPELAVLALRAATGRTPLPAGFTLL